jgi:hypothetical protein
MLVSKLLKNLANFRIRREAQSSIRIQEGEPNKIKTISAKPPTPRKAKTPVWQHPWQQSARLAKLRSPQSLRHRNAVGLQRRSLTANIEKLIEDDVAKRRPRKGERQR